MIFPRQKNKRSNKIAKWLVVFVVLFCLSFGIIGSVVFSPVVVYAQDTLTPAERAAKEKALQADADAAANDAAAKKTAQAKPNPQVGQPDTTQGLMYRVISAIFTPIFELEGYLVAVLTRILMAIVKYNGFVQSPVVQIGWTLVRDVANLFFVVILLAIAIGTILHIESYNFKRLLPKMLIMAILVNFSLVIAGLMIDAAQVIMMTFVSAFAAVTGEGNLIAALKIDKIIFYHAAVGTTASAGGLLLTLLLMVVMLAITIIVLLVMIVVFAIRIVMLWLLLVLAPLPYVLTAWGGKRPQTYYQQWWDEFFKYITVGPVLAFFLWLALAVGSSTDLLDKNAQATSFDVTTNPEASNPLTAIGDPQELTTFIIVIALLMASLMITQQLGVAGGSFAGNMAGRIRAVGAAGLMAPFRVARGAAGLGLREGGGLISRWGAQQSRKGGLWRAAALLSPRTIKEGFAAAKAVSERKAYPTAVGSMHDFINKVNPLIREKGTHYEMLANRATIGEEERKLEASNLTEQELADEYAKAQKAKDPQKAEAARRQMAKSRQDDDYIAGYRGRVYSPEALLHDYLDNYEIFGKEIADEMEADLASTREDNSKERGLGLVTTDFDKKTGVKHTINFNPDNNLKELLTRYNRGDVEKLALANLEGKTHRQVYGDEKDPRRNVIDFASDEGTAMNVGMGDVTTGGVVDYKAKPKDLGKAVATRGQRAAPRKKEEIGFVDAKDKDGRPTGEMAFSSPATWIDAFQHAPGMAAGILANIGADEQTIYKAYKIAKKAADQLGDEKMKANVKEYFEEENKSLTGLDKLYKGVENVKADPDTAVKADALVNRITRVYKDYEFAESDFGPGFEHDAPTRIEVDGKGYGSAAIDPKNRPEGEALWPRLVKMGLTRLVNPKGAKVSAPTSVPASAPTPASTTAPTTTPKPRARMPEDFDQEKYDRTAEQAAQMEAVGLNFFESDKYLKNAGQYETEDKYQQHYLGINQAEVDQIRGVKTAAKKQADAKMAGVGLNFSDPEIQQALGLNPNALPDSVQFDQATGKDQAVKAILAKYSKQLEQDKNINALERQKRISQLSIGLNNAKELSVHNNASVDIGTGARLRQRRHEEYHSVVGGLTNGQRREVFSTAPNAEKVLTAIKQKYPNLNEDQQIEEALVEMAGVGKGEFAVGKNTQAAFAKYGIKTRGEQATETVDQSAKQASVLAAQLRTAKTKGTAFVGRQGEALKAGLNSLAQGLGDLADVPVDVVKTQAKKLAAAYSSLKGFIQDKKVDSAMNELNRATATYNDARVQRADVEQQINPELEQRQKRKSSIQAGYNAAINAREGAIKAGDTAGATRYSQTANSYAKEIEKEDAEIQVLRGKIGQTKAFEAEAVGSLAKARQQWQEVTGAKPKEKITPAAPTPRPQAVKAGTAPQAQPTAAAAQPAGRKPTGYAGRPGEQVFDFGDIAKIVKAARAGEPQAKEVMQKAQAEIDGEEKKINTAVETGDTAAILNALDRISANVAVLSVGLSKIPDALNKSQAESLKSIQDKLNQVGQQDDKGANAPVIAGILREMKVLLTTLVKENIRQAGTRGNSSEVNRISDSLTGLGQKSPDDDKTAR